jgi:hypothetical protein
MRQKLIAVLGVLVLLCGSWINSASLTLHGHPRAPVNTEDGVSFEESVLDDLRPGALSLDPLPSGALVHDHAPPLCWVHPAPVPFRMRQAPPQVERLRSPPFLETLRRPPKTLTPHA